MPAILRLWYTCTLEWAQSVLSSFLAADRQRVVCLKCSSLALRPQQEQLRITRLVASAGITVVSLPLVNEWTQAVHELQEGNVPVAVASDNVRDQFYVYGDLDMLEVFAQVSCRQLLAGTSWDMQTDWHRQWLAMALQSGGFQAYSLAAESLCGCCELGTHAIQNLVACVQRQA
ncbi:hypothetical protein MMC07_000419 [Pseudocyphellaria aurata]|nr:hypothetical protein [Pseudocyphellaria aurata]